MQSWNQWGGASGAGVYNYQSTTAPAASTGTPTAPSSEMQNYNSGYQYYSTPGSSDTSQVDMSAAYNQQAQTQQYSALQQQQWQQWTQWQQQFQQWQQQYGDKYQQAMQGGMQPQQAAAMPTPPPGGGQNSAPATPTTYNPSIQPPLPPLPPPSDSKPTNPPLPSEPPLPPPSGQQPQSLQPPPLPSQGPPPPPPPASGASQAPPPTATSSSSQPPPAQVALAPPQQQQHPPPLLANPHQQPPPPPPPMHHHQGSYVPPQHGGQQGGPMYPTPPHNSYYGGGGAHPYDGATDQHQGYYQSQHHQQPPPLHHRHGHHNMGGEGGESYGGPQSQYSTMAPPYGDGYEGGGGGWREGGSGGGGGGGVGGGRKRPMGGGEGPPGPFGTAGHHHGDKKMRMDVPPPSLEKGGGRFGGGGVVVEDEEQGPPLHEGGWGGSGGHWEDAARGGGGSGGRVEHTDTSKPPPAAKSKEVAPEEELSEAEKSFDAQFEQWEAQFMRWKEQNKNHSDKNQYREYEAKWESWREQLLQRREQMKKKRENGKGSSSDRLTAASLSKMPPLPPEKSPECRPGDGPRAAHGDKWWHESRGREGGRYEGRGGRGRREGEPQQRERGGGGGGREGEQPRMAAAGGGDSKQGAGGSRVGAEGDRFNDGRWHAEQSLPEEQSAQKAGVAKEKKEEVKETVQKAEESERDEVVEVPLEESSKEKNGDLSLSDSGKLGLSGSGGAGKGIPGLDLVAEKTVGAAEDEGETKSEFMARESEDKTWPVGMGKDGEPGQEEWFKRNWSVPEGPGGQRGDEPLHPRRNQGGKILPLAPPLAVERSEEEAWKDQRRGPSGGGPLFGTPEKPPPLHQGNRMHEGGEGGRWGRGGDVYEGGDSGMGPGGRPPMDGRIPPSEDRLDGGEPWSNQHRAMPEMMAPPDGARMMGSGRPPFGLGGGRRGGEGEGKQPWQAAGGPSDAFGGPPPPPGMHLAGMRPMDSDMRNEPPTHNWMPRGGGGGQDVFGPPMHPSGGRGDVGDVQDHFGKPWQQRGGGPPHQDMYGPHSEMRQDGGRPPLMDTDARENINKPWQNRSQSDMFGPDVRSTGSERGQQPNLKPGINQGLNKPSPFSDGPRFPHGEMRPPILPDPKISRDEFDSAEGGRDGSYPRGRGEWEGERTNEFPHPPWHDDHPRNQRYDGGPPRGEGWDDYRGAGRPPMEGDPFDRDHRPFFGEVDELRGVGEMVPDKGPLRRGDHLGRPYGMDHGERFEGEMDDEQWDYHERHGMDLPMRAPPMVWDEPGSVAGPPQPRHTPPPHVPPQPLREWEPDMNPPTVIDYGHISRADAVADCPLDRAPTPPRNFGGSVQTFDYGHGNARNPVPFVMEYEEREQWRGNEYGDRDSRLMGMSHEPAHGPRVWDHDERSPSKGRNFEPPPTKEGQRRESRWEKPRWSNSKHNEADLARWEEEDRYGSERWGGRGGGKEGERGRERDRERGDRGEGRERGIGGGDRERGGVDRDRGGGDRDRGGGDRDRGGGDRDRGGGDRERGGDRSRKGRSSRGVEDERSTSGGGGGGGGNSSRGGHDSDKDRERSSTSTSGSRHKKDESGSGRGSTVGGVSSSGGSGGGSGGSAVGAQHPLVSYPIQSSNSPPPPPVISSQQPQPPLSKVETVLIEDLLSPPGRANRPARFVIILRGPPGSGKTFVAKLIKDKEVDQGGSAPRILALDDYFMVEFEKEEKDPETGRKVTKKFMKYEYEPEMEKQYRSSLIKAFRKTVDDGYFPFIIVDCINDKVRQFDEMWTYAKQKGFQVYICEMDMDVSTCSKRNTHGRSQRNIEDMVKHWEETPRSYVRVDVRSLLQSVAITEVEMEDTTDEKVADTKEDKSESDKTGEKQEERGGAEEDAEKIVVTSKWEGMEASEEKLDRLDGLAKKRRSENHPQSLEDWLQLPDDYEKRKCTPGKKQVRWADLEERRQQERIRAIGFVVGQTDWSRMTDPTFGQGALTQTKYI